MMKRMSFSETVFLFVLALVVFGPKKLPEIARQIGKYLNEFKRASNEFKAQIEQEISHLEVEKQAEKQTILPPSPPPEGTASRALSALSSETGSAETAATVASIAAVPEVAAVGVGEDEPLFATSGAIDPAPVASQPVAGSDAVASTAAQESHV